MRIKERVRESVYTGERQEDEPNRAQQKMGETTIKEERTSYSHHKFMMAELKRK